MQYGGSKNYDQIEAFFVDRLTSEVDKEKKLQGETVEGYAGIAHSFMFTKKIGMKGAEAEDTPKANPSTKSFQDIDKKNGNTGPNLKN